MQEGGRHELKIQKRFLFEVAKAPPEVLIGIHRAMETHMVFDLIASLLEKHV